MCEGLKAPIEKCPHCGSDLGYYTKERAAGSIIRQYNYDGREADNGDMYAYVYGISGGKYAYCVKCDKKLFRMENLD